MQQPLFIRLLLDAFQERKKRNRGYSMRAFARDLNLDVSQVSKLMAQKRIPTIEVGRQIAGLIGLTGTGAQEFCDSIAKARVHQEVGEDPKAEEVIFELEQDLFDVIGNLLHYQVMELTFVEGFQSDARWIAKRLGVTVIEIQQVIMRLVRLGLLESVDGVLKKSNKHIQVRDRSRTTPALKDQQQQILKHASSALYETPIQERHALGMTMAISEEKLPIAKKLMDDFLFKLCDLLEDGKRQRVYQLSMHLFPVDKGQA